MDRQDKDNVVIAGLIGDKSTECDKKGKTSTRPVITSFNSRDFYRLKEIFS